MHSQSLRLVGLVAGHLDGEGLGLGSGAIARRVQPPWCSGFIRFWASVPAVGDRYCKTIGVQNAAQVSVPATVASDPFSAAPFTMLTFVNSSGPSHGGSFPIGQASRTVLDRRKDRVSRYREAVTPTDLRRRGVGVQYPQLQDFASLRCCSRRYPPALGRGRYPQALGFARFLFSSTGREMATHGETRGVRRRLRGRAKPKGGSWPKGRSP
jgi:hypothetical protein